MTKARHSGWDGSPGGGCLAMVLLLCAGFMARGAAAQQAPSPSSSLPAGNLSQEPPTQPGAKQPSAARTGAVSDDSAAAEEVEEQTQLAVQHPGVLIDRVVAVVNGDVILESDVDQERRLVAFQPVADPEGAFTRDRAIERLVNRRLLLQQATLQPHKAVTDSEVDGEIHDLQRDIPACKQVHCDTDAAAWSRFIADQGLTEVELRSYLRDRQEALDFVELRFRTGARISDAEIKGYYEKTMLPEYSKRKVKPPTLEALSDRIQEVLLQQRVSGLLSDWLKSLRAQGTVRLVAEGASS